MDHRSFCDRLLSNELFHHFVYTYDVDCVKLVILNYTYNEAQRIQAYVTACIDATYCIFSFVYVAGHVHKQDCNVRDV